MVQKINRLSARGLPGITKVGRHADGGNLYLVISPNGGRRWTFLYRWRGKPTEIGLGGARDVSLARARELATAARARLAEGLDPRAVRNTAADGKTFGEVADILFESMESSWRNSKHRQQWQNSLRDHANSLRLALVNEITTDDVLKVLQPIWSTKAETASRVRGRIERILDAAAAKGLRSGENPARWRGHLDQLLPKRKRLARGHHTAMPYAAVPAFMAQLGKQEALAALALEFAILTAARSGEVLGARREEFDLAAKVWTVPPERMKAGREHRVPLSDRALEIVTIGEGDFVFPGQRRGKPLSPNAMSKILSRMHVNDAVVHGFRSAFRDWAGNETHFAREVCEAALAHVIEDKTEAAYRHGDALEKRRELMAAWAEFAKSTVVY
jgi:integrase